MPSVIVLGGGMVGSVMAADMARQGKQDVTIADRSDAALGAEVKRAERVGASVTPRRIDLSSASAITDFVRDADIVLGAMPSALGFQTLRAVIEAGCDFCDISFMPEDPRTLDALAKERGVTAIVDCGVAPGMSNLLAGFGASQLDRCDRIEIYVGGIPRDPKPPFFYKAAFSPADVIEEYTRPARIVENGRIVIREALSEPEMIDFPGVGTLEAFNTDGLRSLADTMARDVPNMKEKTLRWPGHIDIMRVLREAGLFSKEPIRIANPSTATVIRPVDLTTALLAERWAYREGEADLTVMRVLVQGEKGGRGLRLSWNLLDRYEPATGQTSMARTTAFPCMIVSRMLASGELRGGPGVLVPESIGRDHGTVDRILAELRGRGVDFRFEATPVEP
jgi:lysine 6-dehydrogenase